LTRHYRLGKIRNLLHEVLMRYLVRAGLPSALLLLCCSLHYHPLHAQAQAPATTDGFLDAGNGVRLYYRLVGPGRDTLVVIHGGPGFSSDYFGHDLDGLTIRGHALLFYDQRGAGRSTLVSDSAGLDGQRFAEDLEAVRRHFKLETVNMLGHSWGAGVVALYASRYPERVGRTLIVGGIPLTMAGLKEAFDGIVARIDTASARRMAEIDSARRINPEDVALCRQSNAIWFHPFFTDTLVEKRLDVCTGSPQARRNAVLAVDRYLLPSLGDYDWRPAMHAVSAPTLVIHGEKEVLPLAGAREWVATMPNSRLLAMPGVGHFLYMEDPEPFFAAVDTFLKGGWPAGSERASGP
jgi:proline iminopeptidase